MREWFASILPVVREDNDNLEGSASFELDEVEHRMRWIASGAFMMGSPQDERGRWDAEGPQHEVTLTCGYWLGETEVV
jgi:formylglycine-generating enzyme required for sulfatase activity